ncbi:YggT family protein [Microbaculum marinisediminis]|uniref:YggT family protein n=1 Tax=Microbaculum marinisediminis TaxID=2931392 RepID=A0AAW5QRS2_9HYPH|nr:YggT family protein [Microbaculum sp. A6E488]MCT8970665.1 YggT family protein [Microbaculum sp. A6E488]
MDVQVPLIALIPNYVLAALMYTLLGRFILSFMFPPDSKNYIFRAFVRLTDPVLALVRPITPAAVPHLVLLVFAAIWILVARIVLTVAAASALQAA